MPWPRRRDRRRFRRSAGAFRVVRGVTAATWLVVASAGMAAGRLPSVPSFATLTSYARPMSTSVAASNAGFSVDVASALTVQNGVVDLGSESSGGHVPAEAVFTLHGYDQSLPVTLSVQGALQTVISGLALAPDGKTVVANFVPSLPTVKRTTTYTGALTVTVGNGWNTASVPAEATIVPPPVGLTGSVSGAKGAAGAPVGSFSGPVGGTVTGSVYQNAVTVPGSAQAYTLTAPFSGEFNVPVQLAGTGAGRYMLFGLVHGTVNGMVPAADTSRNTTVELSGSVTGSVYGSVYNQTTGVTSYLLNGAVAGQASGAYAWTPGSGEPGPFTGSFTGTVTGSVYAADGSTQTVTGAAYGTGGG